ncbi:MAG: NupC/NupG family nucleoside CNT transporter [Phycisphaerales bacterium]
MAQLSGLLGVIGLLTVAWLFSADRRRVPVRVIVVGLALQFALAGLLLGVPPVARLYDLLARAFTRLLSFSDAGAAFLFRDLADASGPWGFVFAFKVLPVIVFFASLMAVLYHLGIMQRLVGVLAWALRRTLGVSGPEALAAAANVFVGQTEAPLSIKAYLDSMTRSQLMLVMTGGFATIAGSVLAAFVTILGGESDELRSEFARHLLTASAMSAPGAFVMAKLFLPETEGGAADGPAAAMPEITTQSVLDAVTQGAGEGLRLALNVAAMLVAFVALLAMIDWPLAELSGTRVGQSLAGLLGAETLSLSAFLGLLFRPIGWAMGLAGGDAAAVGSLLGTSIIATEFVAYIELGELLRQDAISPRAAAVATYALCGFANIPSMAIQIGGLTALAPSRRAEIVALAPRAMIAGAMTCWMTGCIASLFIPA